jgi:hypothetical protein
VVYGGTSMPAKSSKKKIKKQVKSGFLIRLRQIVTRYPGVTFVTFLLFTIAFAGYAYNAITDFQDNRTAQQYKKQLDQIDKKMAVEFDAIIADLGTPVDVSRDKTCEYVSADFDPGLPSCGPVYYVYYSFEDITESTQFISEATASIGHNTRLQPKDKSYSDPNDMINIRRNVSDTYDLSNLIRCSVETRRSKEINKPTDINVSISYRCSQVSPKPIYREVNK